MITRVGHPHGFSRITCNPSPGHWTFHLGIPALLSRTLWLPLVHTLGTTIVVEATQDTSHNLIYRCQVRPAWVEGFQQRMSTLGWGHTGGTWTTRGLPPHTPGITAHTSIYGRACKKKINYPRKNFFRSLYNSELSKLLVCYSVPQASVLSSTLIIK